MPITPLKTFSLLSILLLCSCSDVSNTAQVPEITNAASRVSQKTVQPAPPADILLQSKELFGSTKPKGSVFADDSLLKSQDSFETLGTGDVLQIQQADFSQDIVP